MSKETRKIYNWGLITIEFKQCRRVKLSVQTNNKGFRVLASIHKNDISNHSILKYAKGSGNPGTHYGWSASHDQHNPVNFYSA